MPDLRLARLPDRTAVKITISVPPELSDALRDYADLYLETYGEAEAIQELIPAMLAGFLESDRAFARRRRRSRSDGRQG